MTVGEWRGRALVGALVALMLAVAAGCDERKDETRPGETVADGTGPVLEETPAPDPAEEVPGSGVVPPVQDPVEDVTGPEDDPVVVEDPPEPEQEPEPVDPAAETGRLSQFWTEDRFILDREETVTRQQQYTWELLAKAKPDECFNGVGQPYGVPDANGACATGEPKVNDSYVWGITIAGGKLFFGTLANTLCAVEGGYLEMAEPQLFDEWVCEFAQSVKGSDGRAPNMFMYDPAVGGYPVSLNPDAVNPTAGALRRATGGFRSAGSHQDANGNAVAFIAGTGRPGGINMFAFDAATGQLIGDGKTIGGSACISATPPGQPACPGDTMYINVRQWTVAEGNLYLGVGTYKRGATATDPPIQGGAVLKWVGDLADPYRFIEVGHLPADAANMIGHTDGRLYITTWPSRTKGDKAVGPDGEILGVPAGLYRSPPIPAGGLTEADIDDPEWSVPLWLATSDGKPEHAFVPTYDPDRMAGLHTGGGALVSYEDKVYFGTMTVPMYGVQDAAETYEPPPGEFLRTWLGVHRPIALFEVVFVGDQPDVAMIVGEKYLPTYDPAMGGYTIRYDAAHRTGFEPRWAPSGFGNFWNTYTWAMRVYDGQVFVGTMDWSQLARINAQQAFFENLGLPQAFEDWLLAVLGYYGLPGEGADLFRFTSDTLVAESTNGVGNNRNYGVRNMVTDGEVLYIGTANPMNLDPRGGWELIRLQ